MKIKIDCCILLVFANLRPFNHSLVNYATLNRCRQTATIKGTCKQNLANLSKNDPFTQNKTKNSDMTQSTYEIFLQNVTFQESFTYIRLDSLAKIIFSVLRHPPKFRERDLGHTAIIHGNCKKSAWIMIDFKRATRKKNVIKPIK